MYETHIHVSKGCVEVEWGLYVYHLSSRIYDMHICPYNWKKRKKKRFNCRLSTHGFGTIQIALNNPKDHALSLHISPSLTRSSDPFPCHVCLDQHFPNIRDKRPNTANTWLRRSQEFFCLGGLYSPSIHAWMSFFFLFIIKVLYFN
jgi:hypothetical protein